MALPLRHLAIGIGSLILSGCNDSHRPVIQMMFGTSPVSWNSPQPAGDYIKSFHIAIPQAAETCRTRLLGIDGTITDGGEAVYFSTDRNVDQALSCLKRVFPQVRFDLIEKDEWDRMTREHPGFPIPFDQMPPSSEPPPE